MAPLLPNSVRAFCLLLNALKQWVNKEQIAMDGYLFSSFARSPATACGRVTLWIQRLNFTILFATADRPFF